MQRKLERMKTKAVEDMFSNIQDAIQNYTGHSFRFQSPRSSVKHRAKLAYRVKLNFRPWLCEKHTPFYSFANYNLKTAQNTAEDFVRCLTWDLQITVWTNATAELSWCLSSAYAPPCGKDVGWSLCPSPPRMWGDRLSSELQTTLNQ